MVEDININFLVEAIDKESSYDLSLFQSAKTIGA
jgi:hypothetical protein